MNSLRQDLVNQGVEFSDIHDIQESLLVNSYVPSSRIFK